MALKHSHRWDVLKILGELRLNLSAYRPWLVGEKAYFQGLNKLSQTVQAIDLVLRPDHFGGRTILRELEMIRERLPNCWIDHFPLSGALRFLWRS
jgi:hypothetical protein